MTSLFILSSKVRSRALLFLYKLFFQLVYHVFYRNLVSSKSDNRPCLRGIIRIIGLVELVQFARLRSPSQFATVQLLSSISVVIIFPLQMTKIYHRSLQILIGYPSTWEDHVDNVASSFYCRGLAQNVTMLGFLGKYCPPFQRGLSVNGFQAGSQFCISVQMLVRPISHPPGRSLCHTEVYPFFRFSPTPEDPYTFPLTFTASCAIWVSDLFTHRPQS